MSEFEAVEIEQEPNTKMGISGAVQWWEEWQLRILVLASLSAQYFLVLSARARKLHLPPWQGRPCVLEGPRRTR